MYCFSPCYLLLKQEQLLLFTPRDFRARSMQNFFFFKKATFFLSASAFGMAKRHNRYWLVLSWLYEYKLTVKIFKGAVNVTVVQK